MFSNIESAAQTQASVQSLSLQERSRLHELERRVERTLESFLECGRALLEVRDRRLYRECYNNFDDYLRKRWGITYAQGHNLIRSTRIAEHLLAGPASSQGDAPLPPDLAEDTLRPLQRLSPELQCACWRLASRLSQKPTRLLLSRIVATVTRTIQSANGAPSRSQAKHATKAIFWGSVIRLAKGENFSAQLLAARITDHEKARHCSSCCRILISRCEAILRELERRFPDL